MSFVVRRSTLLDTEILRSSDHTLLILSAELDASVAGLLHEELASLNREGLNHVTLDLSDRDFLDSVGIGAILSEHMRTEAAGGELTMLNPRRNVRKVFEVAGLVDVLSIFPPSRCRSRVKG